MARAIPADRIPNLVDAAIRVFSRKGFRRAQMADIAGEMGVSSGSLYNYVESKEALFHLVIDQGFREQPPKPVVLPVPTPPPGAIARRVTERFGKQAEMRALSAALTRPRSSDPQDELEGIIGELYAVAYRTAGATTLFDRCAMDLPELADIFYGRMRQGIVSRLARLIESRVRSGQYRRVPHPAVAARLVIETITWFARNRRGDPASQDISDTAAEETTVDFIVNSLVATGRAKAGAPRDRRT